MILFLHLLGRSAERVLSGLLAILVFGSVWGITGMVLAVPLTAVIRIYLQGLDHPLAKFVANVLAGKESGKSVAPL